MDNDQKKISNTSAALMISVAALYDGVQALLTFFLVGFLVNWLISIFAILTFFTWFKIKGVQLANFKKSAVLVIASFLELTPLGFVPSFVVSVAIIIAITRTEDLLLSKKRQEELDQLILAIRRRELSEIKNVIKSNQARQRKIVDTIRTIS